MKVYSLFLAKDIEIELMEDTCAGLEASIYFKKARDQRLGNAGR